MAAREYLQQYASLCFRYNKKVELMNRTFEKATRITSVAPDLPRVNERDNQFREELAVKMCGLEGEVLELQTKVLEMYDELQDMIFMLSKEASKEIIYRRYIDGDDWDDIVKATGLSRSYVFKLHKSAIQEIDQMIADKECNKLIS